MRFMYLSDSAGMPNSIRLIEGYCSSAYVAVTVY
jgi:hypothetical protein